MDMSEERGTKRWREKGRERKKEKERECEREREREKGRERDNPVINKSCYFIERSSATDLFVVTKNRKIREKIFLTK